MVISEKPVKYELEFKSGDLKSLLTACYQCSSCASICPIHSVSTFNPRKIILDYIYEDIVNEDDITTCLTCGACVEVCPQEVNFPEFMRISREKFGVEESLFAHHNIFNLMQIFMNEMTDSGMKFDFEGELDQESSIAYFPGCVDLYDKFLDLKETDFHQIGQSAVNIINKVGIKPNLLSLKCCGHDAYWTGDINAYEEVRNYNTKVIKESGITTLIVSCAECYYSFGSLYDLEGVNVQHISQLIDKNLDKLKFGEEATTLTYHDPCRLGRFMKEYDSPRNALEASGASIKELPSHKEVSKCCGVSAWLKCDDISRAIMLQKLEDATQVVGEEGTLAVACSKCYAHLNCVLEDKRPQHNYKIKVRELGTIIDERSNSK
ncbi:MAG: (Fe-S)-binding protein [Candidatus Hodarchaeales archaeon]